MTDLRAVPDPPTSSSSTAAADRQAERADRVAALIARARANLRAAPEWRRPRLDEDEPA